MTITMPGSGTGIRDDLIDLDAWWRAANYRRADLSSRQSAGAAAASVRGRQAAAARPLGHEYRPQLRLRAPEPRHPRLALEARLRRVVLSPASLFHM